MPAALEPLTPLALLVERAEHTPAALAYRFLREDEVLTLDYRTLFARAQGVAAALSAHARPGAHVLITCPPGLDYVIALFGTFTAGMVAVPAPASRAQKPNERVAQLLATGAIDLVLSVRQLCGEAGFSCPTVCIDACGEATFSPPGVNAQDLLVLQYTSGSTRAPRGVRVLARNVRENCQRIVEAGQFTPDDGIVSWLPPHHDMGLLAGILAPLYAGVCATLLSPLAFLTRPVRWLEAIQRYGGTHAGAPDFAYALCARRVREEDKRALDLSSWRVAWSGAERIRSETLRAFRDAFVDVGFRAAALRPCYGLAEATLMVTVSHGVVRELAVSESALAQGNVTTVGDDLRALVSSGEPIPGHEVRIVDPVNFTEEEGVGEIWVRGPSVADGYLGAEADDTFAGRLAGEGPFLRTGDLGFMRDGALYVTGRLKELLIVHGRNLYPEDLEYSAQQVSDVLRPGAGVAFSVEHAGEERVCIVQEVEARHADLAALSADVRARLLADYEVTLHELLLVAPGQVPRTTSGKLQRARTRELYLAGALRVRHRSGEVALFAASADAELVALVQRECADLFELDEVRADQDLFALGAQSVLIMQLAMRLERALGLEVPVRALFEHPTPALLARALTSAAHPARRQSTLAASDGPAPLSQSQGRIWFEQMLSPESTAYHVSGALLIRGPLRVDLLEQSLQEVIARHGVLHARFEHDAHGVRQVRAAVPVVKLTLEGESSWNALVERPFVLEREPVFRVGLFERGPGLHALLVVIHHLAVDGLSMDVLVDEVCSSYEARHAGREPELGPIPVDAATYARSESALVSSERMERALSYFADRLRGAPGPPELPTDRPRPAHRRGVGDLLVRTMPRELVRRLDAFCLERGATRYMVMLAAYAVLLSRLSRERDLTIGTPVSGRLLPEVERTVGSFVNMVALRMDVPLEAGFAGFVAEVRALALDAFEHRMAPFERVVERVAPPRSAAHAPLFDVMFDYQAMRHLRTSVADLAVAPELVRRGASQYDLSLSVLALGDDTTFHLEYRSDLFDRSTVEGFLSRLLLLLEAGIDTPDVPLARLPWLHPGEREALCALGAGPLRPGSTASFLEAFAARVAEHPERTAVTDGVHTLSYRELERDSRALAAQLVALGVGPEERVAILLERTVRLPVALCAVLAAGGAYVPLDPAHPQARRDLVLSDAAPRVLLTDRRTQAPAGTHVLRIDEPYGVGMVREPPALTHDSLAYVLFTSGSTGRPKGVEVSHGALANFLASMARAPGLRPEERVLAVTTVSFDIAALELLLPLYVGAEIELATRALASDGVALARRLERGDIALFQATPATYTMLADAGFRGHPALTLLCGGEALPRGLADTLRTRCRALHNMYGPTETTVWSARFEVGEGEGPVPIGHAIDRTRLRIMDEHGEPVPQGVLGELWIGGEGVARGYRGRPELTTSRFVHEADTGERAYRTGDLARLARDGTFQYVGRIDRQVKLRGHRIELGDIEAALAACTGVRACAVELTSGRLGPRLVAYVVGEYEEASLRGELEHTLPGYMVPSRFVKLEALPLSPSGKVDRRALPEVPDEVPRELVSPRTSDEALVCALFAAVLERPVGVHDDFFALGGHSLLALRLFEELYARTAVRLLPSSLFEAPTPESLARALEAARHASPERARVLHVGNGKARILFVHPHGSGDEALLDWYRPLCAQLNQPVLLSTLDENAYLSIDELGRTHADAAPADEPLVLVGLGLGGNVARAMASVLEARGARVDAVVMIASRIGDGLVRGLFRKMTGKKPALETIVDRAELPRAYRDVSDPQWNALLGHAPPPVQAKLVHVHGRDARGLGRAREVHPQVLSVSEAELVLGGAHDELAAVVLALLEPQLNAEKTGS